MGTRGLIGFVVNNQVIGVYNHFDSYPSGVGSDVLDYARSIDNLVELRRSVFKLKAIDEMESPTPEQIKTLKSKGIEGPANVSTGSDWYAWLRGIQGNLAEYLRVGFMPDNSGFGNDSLFCEWAYLINTDDNTFEVYKGFQKEAHTGGRFSEFVPEDGGYYGVRLIATYRLTALPSPEVWGTFEADLNESEEKEEPFAPTLAITA